MRIVIKQKQNLRTILIPLFLSHPIPIPQQNLLFHFYCALQIQPLLTIFTITTTWDLATLITNLDNSNTLRLFFPILLALSVYFQHGNKMILSRYSSDHVIPLSKSCHIPDSPRHSQWKQVLTVTPKGLATITSLAQPSTTLLLSFSSLHSSHSGHLHLAVPIA